jgi:hypothetical protein
VRPTIGACTTLDCTGAAAIECVNAGGLCTASRTCNCAPVPLCNGCNTNDDCASGLCTNGTCQTTTCSASADCTSFGGTCRSDGSCQCTPPAGLCAGCDVNTDCASGSCNATTGFCQNTTDCHADQGCASQGFVCGADGGCLCQ